MKFVHKLPATVVERDGPFQEFKQDGAVVTVETSDGKMYSPVLIIAPDYLAAIPDCPNLPFSPSDVARVYQTPENLETRSSASWSWYTKGKEDLDFASLPTEEQEWYIRDTWCHLCKKPDLGIVDPTMFREAGITYVSGKCTVCGNDCETMIFEKRVTE